MKPREKEEPGGGITTEKDGNVRYFIFPFPITLE